MAGAYTLLPWHQACLGVFLLAHGRNESPLYVASTHLYSWVKRDKEDREKLLV